MVDGGVCEVQAGQTGVRVKDGEFRAVQCGLRNGISGPKEIEDGPGIENILRHAGAATFEPRTVRLGVKCACDTYYHNDGLPEFSVRRIGGGG